MTKATNSYHNCLFRLYSPARKSGALSSSVFDMISGQGTEPQKTKALAYMLSYCFEFRTVFVRYILEKWEKKNATLSEKYEMVVWAERPLGERRADIVILPRGKNPQWIILIEAKDTDVRAEKNGLQEQLKDYQKRLKELYPNNPEIIPVALTRDIIDLSGDYLSVSWRDIINRIYDTKKKHICKQDKLFTDFFDFLTQYNMKTYEEDILSIPAKDTIELIEKYGIYKCPNTKQYSHKSALFLTFRAKDSPKGKAVMKKLYPLKAVYLLDEDINEEGLFDLEIPEEDKKSIAQYQKEEKSKKRNEPHKFYVLDKANCIQLQKVAIPKRPPQKHVYYRLCDILHPDKCEELEPSSRFASKSVSPPQKKD